MNKKIFSINFEIPGHTELYLDFTSKKSLMDADIILIDSEIPYYERTSINNGFYLGKICLGEAGSFNFRADKQHWKTELTNSLKAGKTIFLLLNKKEDFFLDTGTRSYSGTGRNRSTTVNVEPGNNYEFLPINIGSITSANGTHIESKNNSLFQPFFEQFQNYLEYRVYLDNLPESIVIFTGKDKSKVLGAVYKVGAGHFVVLPYLTYDEEKFTEYRKNEKKKEETFWTKKAVVYGKNLIGCLLSIDKGLSQASLKTPAPVWINNDKFCSPKEIALIKEIEKIDRQIEAIIEDKKRLNMQLLEEQSLKDLLYEQGKPLELAVIKALIILGYQAENYNDGELEIDQVIISPEKRRYIGECEGKDNKDILVNKFRQLLDALNADFAREEIKEKAFGLLFGNPERLQEPSERKLDFTKKCKAGAEREKFSLIKTADLFYVTKYLSENNDENFKKLCRDTIHLSLGKVVKFPSIHTDDKK